LPGEPDLVNVHLCTECGLSNPLTEYLLPSRIDYVDNIAANQVFPVIGAEKADAGRIYLCNSTLLIYDDSFRQPLDEMAVPLFAQGETFDIRYVILDK